MAVLVSIDADIKWATPFPGVKLSHIMSSGAYLVVFKDTISGKLHYATSTDTGATWSTPVPLPGTPSPTGLQVALVRSDVLYLWYAGSNLQLYTSAYDTGGNTLGAQTVYTYVFPGVASVLQADVVYDGGWNVVVSVNLGSKNSIAVLLVPGFDGALSSYQQYLDLGYWHTGLNTLRCVTISGFLLAVFFDATRKTLCVAPVARSLGSFNWQPANLETAITLTDAAAVFNCVIEPGDILTTVLVASHTLYSLTRTGAFAYSKTTSLDGQIVDDSVPDLLLDGSDLYTSYETDINQSNGETYFVKRTASIWGLPQLFAGGSSSGFQAPDINVDTLLYQDAANNLFFGAWSPSGAPLPPTNVKVNGVASGNIMSLTPTATWVSNPSAPGDPVKSHEVVTVRISDNAVMDDSNEVLGSATSYDVPGGAGLTYGVQYGTKVRERDILSNSWGSYSALALFTVVRGATPSIASITSGGSTVAVFPATIHGADLAAHVNYTQPDGHATNAYRIKLYAADDVALLSSTPMQALSPAVASGAAFDTIAWTSGELTNGGAFHVSVETADAVSGVISESAHVELLVVFTPPAAPSGLTATVDVDDGSVTLAWGNDGATVTTKVEWQPYTRTGRALGWFQAGSSGQLWNGAIIKLQAPQCIADYRVTAYSDLGIASAPSVVTAVYLDNALEYAGIWLNDMGSDRQLYMGYPDGSFDSFVRDRAYDMQEWTPMGAKKPIHSFGLMAYWIIGQSQGMKIFLPADETGEFGEVHYGDDNRDVALEMADSHNTILYRDRRFPIPAPIKFVSYRDQPDDDENTDLIIELHETSFFGPLPLTGTLLLE